jgi:hypothetical protein
MKKLIYLLTRRRLRLFISYDREDTAGHSGRLRDDLISQFGTKNVFRDRESINAGEDFAQSIEMAITSSNVLIAIIGREWLNRINAKAQRPAQPDFVRLEIASALEQKISVVPILIEGAAMPGPHDLPDDLVPLSHLHAIEIRDSAWGQDVKRLSSALNKYRPLSKQKFAITTACFIGILACSWAILHARQHRAGPLSDNDMQVVQVAADITQKYRDLKAMWTNNKGTPAGEVGVNEAKHILMNLGVSVPPAATAEQVFDLLWREITKGAEDLSYRSKIAKAMGIR